MLEAEEHLGMIEGFMGIKRPNKFKNILLRFLGRSAELATYEGYHIVTSETGIMGGVYISPDHSIPDMVVIRGQANEFVDVAIETIKDQYNKAITRPTTREDLEVAQTTRVNVNSNINEKTRPIIKLTRNFLTKQGITLKTEIDASIQFKSGNPNTNRKLITLSHILNPNNDRYLPTERHAKLLEAIVIEQILHVPVRIVTLYDPKTASYTIKLKFAKKK